MCSALLNASISLLTAMATTHDQLSMKDVNGCDNGCDMSIQMGMEENDRLFLLVGIKIIQWS